MDALRHQLLHSKTIPYICKKNINDSLCENVLPQLGWCFFSKVYKTAAETFQNELCLVKGGVAVAAHLFREFVPSPFSDLDLQVHANRPVTAADVFDLLPVRKLQVALQESVGREYVFEIENILSCLNMTDLLDDYSKRQSQKLIIFKSYENAAVEFSAADQIVFRLNRQLPIKITVSAIEKDNSVLVRYSFNVHATSDIPMWLHSNRASSKLITYFPFDLYFLDVSVVSSRFCDAGANDVVRRDMFGVKILVDVLPRVVADQLECLMFNVFNLARRKMESRLRRLESLVVLLPKFSRASASFDQKRCFYSILNGNDKYTIENVKEILYRAGPALGSRLLIELFFMKRLKFTVAHVTHQINFPYRFWDKCYFSKCWKKYCFLLNELFNLNYTIRVD
ncbi:unknown [Euproctis pseudoconspersa nucleopolyhedrovirus]|uniref:Ac18 n=1 Tax=Euproctis pseudoconspersa nucleopolyhedrovirus TaxID=307467 RepID=C3TX18_9ABAC|nr:hypothetical protein EupsNPV_gp110 [Euproctis pseudoconspersa nucleopolyhedrovirus]ACO53560.1 unknown [Euproctis pseudoconspersa nucleopolyhedrovirus]